MTLREANCTIKYTTFLSSGTTVDNELGDAAYDGTVDANRYTTTPSGASAQTQTANTHYLTIPDGASSQPGSAWTMEWGFKYNDGGPATAYLFQKSTKFSIYYVKATGRLWISRYTNEGAQGEENTWYATLSLVDGTWYDLQVTSTGAPNAPPTVAVKLNDGTKTVTADTYDPYASWKTTAGTAATLCNSNAHTAALWDTLTIFRMHSAALSSEYLSDNYAEDSPRWTVVTWTQTIVPAMTMAPEQLSINPTVALTTVPAMTATVSTLIIHASSTIAIPTVPGMSMDIEPVTPDIVSNAMIVLTKVPSYVMDEAEVTATAIDGLAILMSVPDMTMSVEPAIIDITESNPTVAMTVPSCTMEAIGPPSVALTYDATVLMTVPTMTMSTETVLAEQFDDTLPMPDPIGVDITMDEQTTKTIKVVVTKPDGTLPDITGYDVEWNATDSEGTVMISKDTTNGKVILGGEVDGIIKSFLFKLHPEDTALEELGETPVLYHHEARLTNGSDEYIGARGRMFITPSITAE